MVAQRAAVGQLVELGHSVFHKFGRLEDEWVCILPIVIHRILTQYQDIQNYKKVGVCLLSLPSPFFVTQGELGKLEHSLGGDSNGGKTT